MRETSQCKATMPDLTAGMYSDMRRRLRTDMVPGVFDVLASVPACSYRFWLSLQPAFSSGQLRDLAGKLRSVGRRAASGLAPSNGQLVLSAQNSTREDNRRIRYAVELFFHMEPVFAILAAAAKNWLDGGSSGGVFEECYPDGTEPYLFGRVEIPAFEDSRAIPQAVIDRYSGECPKLLRALSVWPSSISLVLDMLENKAFEQALSAVHCAAAKLSGAIYSRGQHEESHCALFRGVDSAFVASCEMIVIACALRSMLLDEETKARSKRVRESL